MNYRALACEFMQKSCMMARCPEQKQISGLVNGEMFVLNFLFLKNETAMPGEISEEMGVSTARMATILGSLEKKELIERKIDRTDRRKIIVSITSFGIRIVKEKRECTVSKVEKLLMELGEEDALEFVRLMGKVTDISFRCCEDEE